MDKKDIGALWKRKAKSGVEYMSGNLSIDGVAMEIVVFSNKKGKDNHPDFRIYQSEPPQKQDVPAEDAPATPGAEVGGDGIPF
jgi:uncharacterized protein (DUF736 family)